MYCGGQGIYSFYLTRALARLGHEVHLVAGPPYPEKPDGVTLHKIPNPNFFEKGSKAFKELDLKEIFHPLTLYEWIATQIGNFPEILGFSLRMIEKIKDLHEKIGFDVIHDNQCLGYGFLITQGLGIPQIATIHHPLKIDREKSLNESKTFLGKILNILYYPLVMQRISLRAFDRIITVSEASVKDIEKHFGVPQESIKVIQNGIDEKLFKPQNRNGELADENNEHHSKNMEQIEDDSKVPEFLFVGETENKHKGFRVLLQSLEKLMNRGENFRLTVINGNTPDSEYTERLIRKYNLNERTEFLGRVETLELVKQYNSATAVVVPSLHEGFGLPSIEAMSCGTPLVTTTSGALTEIVSSDAGILVPPKNPSKLADGIQEMIKNPIKRKEMGEKGRKKVKNNFTWKEAAKDVVEVYEEAKNAGNH